MRCFIRAARPRLAEAIGARTRQSMLSTRFSRVSSYAAKYKNIQIEDGLRESGANMKGNINSLQKVPPASFSAKGLHVLRRQSDGSWKFAGKKFGPVVTAQKVALRQPRSRGVESTALSQCPSITRRTPGYERSPHGPDHNCTPSYAGLRRLTVIQGAERTCKLGAFCWLRDLLVGTSSFASVVCPVGRAAAANVDWILQARNLEHSHWNRRRHRASRQPGWDLFRSIPSPSF